ncbi:MAG: carbohydrate ABC transporter permease [Pseudomonadota bacterium]
MSTTAEPSPLALTPVATLSVAGARIANAARLVAVHALLILALVFVLGPIIWMLTTSVKPANEIFQAGIDFMPRNPQPITNYSDAFASVPLLQFMMNGVIVCAGILVVQLLTSIPCAYALAKIRFRGAPVVFALVLLGLCIPIQVPALPLYLAFAQLGLLNTYLGLMLPFFLSVFAIFLFRQFFRSFPDEIIQAARVDGMSEFEIVWRVVVPSAWPAIAAFSVFSVTAHWNDLYWPLIVVSKDALATPPLGVAFFFDAETGSDFGSMMAAATLVSAPLIIAFLVAQRQFIQGITMTGLK